MRSHNLSNRVYRDADHISRATGDAWNSLTQEHIRTVCNVPSWERMN